MIRPNPDAISLEWETPEELTQLAIARMRQGYAPPPEVYQIQFRSRINWAELPVWARPINPEVFDGCCHEG